MNLILIAKPCGACTFLSWFESEDFSLSPLKFKKNWGGTSLFIFIKITSSKKCRLMTHDSRIEGSCWLSRQHPEGSQLCGICQQLCSWEGPQRAQTQILTEKS
jgi:hypothetical protein